MCVQYETGTPVESGVYACRVPMTHPSGNKVVRNCREPEHLCEDLFLYWDGEHWSHLGSAGRYRLEVPFFLGPLARVHQKA